MDSSRRQLVPLCLLITLAGCETVPSAPGGAALRSPIRSSASGPLTAPVRTIVIDAGHGGHDPGTAHYGLREKHLALDVARRLRAHLQRAGLTVVMTRDSDQFIPLSGRPRIANRLRADLFISVHINANHNQRVSGSEVYYPRQSVVATAAHWPPSVSPSEIGVPSMTVKQVLWDLVLSKSRARSRRLASSVCHAMRGELQVVCRGPKSARFVVLRESWMPSVLVEVGYLSNPVEAKRLASPAYRQAAADSIARGILSYIGQWDA